MAPVIIMGSIPTVSASTLKRIAGVSGKQNKKVTWHSSTIIVRQLLPIDEFVNTVREIIRGCIAPDGGFAIELLDFVMRVKIVSAYAYIELPEELDDIYYIIYASDLFETVCSNINQSQLEAIKSTVSKAIETGCFYEQGRD